LTTVIYRDYACVSARVLTTTALALSAGVAAADVTLSGDARMGITYNSALTTNKAAFVSRARVTFTLTGETDGGLAFGGSFRADNAGGAAAGTAGSVFVSGDFGKLTMGDTAGAAGFINGHVAGIGLTGFSDIHEIAYLGNPGGTRPTARYEYSIDAFTVAVSHTNPSFGSKVSSIGASYKIEGFTLGLGVERQNARSASAPVAPVAASCSGTAGVDISGLSCVDATATFTAAKPGVAAVTARGAQTHIVLSAAYTMDGITVKALGGQLRTAGAAAKQNQFAVSASGKFDEITVTAFGRRDFAKNTYVGIGGIYDLGGGASLRGGIVNTNPNAPTTKSTTQADFGLNFSF
jgi:outer membrane protein OmpU